MDLTSLNDTFLNHVPIVDQSQSRGASVSSGNPGSSASASAPCTDEEEEEEEEATASASLIKLIVKYLDNVVSTPLLTVIHSGIFSVTPPPPRHQFNLPS